MEKLFQRGIENGLEGLRKLNYEEAKTIEPNVVCKLAIHVPLTGITDYTIIAKKLLELSKNKGVEVIFNYTVSDFKVKANSVEVISDNKIINAHKVINCAGLYSDEIGIKAGDNMNHKIMPYKGEFFKLKPEKCPLVKCLVYPIANPEFPFLGVHLTRMIDGNVKVGPNAILAFKKEEYKKFEFSVKDFFIVLLILDLLN